MNSLIRLFASASVAAVALIASATANPAPRQAVELSCDCDELSAELDRIIAERPPENDFGIVLASISDFPPQLVQKARKELNMGPRLQIISVEPGSVADRMGLLPGDELIQVNDYSIARGEFGLRRYFEVIGPNVDWNGKIFTTIIRNGYGEQRSI